MYWMFLCWTGIISVTSQTIISGIYSKSSSNCFYKMKNGYENFEHVAVSNISWFDNDMCKRRNINQQIIHIFELIPRNKTSFTFRELYICFPDNVFRGRVMFNAVILKTKPNLSVTSLCKPHDIFTITKNPRQPIYVLLRMYPVSPLTVMFSPQTQHRQRKLETPPRLHSGYHRHFKMHKRHVFSPANYTTETNIIDAASCGRTRGCYRDGENSCQHFECNYFISYWTNNKIADIELSGKSNGWVAIGFSSDTEMGTDEVFACAYGNDGNYINVGSYKNTHHHIRPVPVKNFAILKHSEARNEFMYCRFEVPVKRQGSTVDLTNEWTQFYARGTMKGGLMEKHSERPIISETQISIVQHPNIISCASSLMSLDIMFVLSCLLLMSIN